MGNSRSRGGGDKFPMIESCSSSRREGHTVAADFDGCLVRSRSSYPYFMLVALEAGSFARAVALGLTAPLSWLLYHFISESSAIKMLAFVTFYGLKVSEIERVARAVLPKFYSQDVHSDSYRVFSSCGKKYVVTANPRVMVEFFAKTYLGADKVLGSEIEVDKRGRATGWLNPPGVLVGENKKSAVLLEFQDGILPEIGIGDRETDYPFMSLCKEGYIVPKKRVNAVDQPNLCQPVVFHDGRLVNLPTPLSGLVTFLWFPIGLVLSIVRVALTAPCPRKYVGILYKLLGVRVIVKGMVPKARSDGDDKGTLFVCNHRTLLDPIFVGVAGDRTITGLTYSVSWLSELLSPIATVRLSRDKERDAEKMKGLLNKGKDLCLCPEGTTCREPYLLRFSALFTELTDRIVPVAVKPRQGMFHGSAVKGFKGFDAFFFFMNPIPTYEVEFLEQLPAELTVQHGGKSPIEVANLIQKMLADTLGYKCTTLTRKEKYQVLVGSDGTVPEKGKAKRG